MKVELKGNVCLWWWVMKTREPKQKVSKSSMGSYFGTVDMKICSSVLYASCNLKLRHLFLNSSHFKATSGFR